MLEEYSAQGESVEKVTGDDGLERKVVRASDGGIAPTINIYTDIFDQRIGDIELLGLSCYLPDWRIPGGTEEMGKASLDALLLKRAEEWL